eukprot:Gb_32956 [translate_table: standard]
MGIYKNNGVFVRWPLVNSSTLNKSSFFWKDTAFLRVALDLISKCTNSNCDAKLRKHLNELLIEQLPVLKDLLWVLEELALRVPPNLSNNKTSRLILEQVY